MSFSSDPATGAIPIGVDGDAFGVDLFQPLKFDPRQVVSVDAAVIQASIWSVSPNVSPSFENNEFTFTTSAAPAGAYTITFPQGLYSLTAIGSFIGTQLVNLGLPANLFLLSGDDATQRVIITFLIAGDSIDFAAANSIATLLGYSTAALDNPVVAPIAGFNAYGDTTAQLNRNSSYRIRSTLSSGGIQSNAISSGVIVGVPIDVPAGNQINYSPTNPAWFDMNELIGTGKQSLAFYLENQSGAPTPSGGEYWSLTIAFKYTLRSS
jgi:hypothetical protein